MSGDMTAVRQYVPSFLLICNVVISLHRIFYSTCSIIVAALERAASMNEIRGYSTGENNLQVGLLYEQQMLPQHQERACL